MLPAVVPITGAGLLVGVLVVGAATLFWVRRRRQKLTVLAGPLGGLAMTAGLTAVLSPDFEMNPDAPPGTVVDVPYPPIGVVTVAVFVIALGAAGHAQRRITRADPAAVLRDTI
jgi:hypothetical protein